MPGKRHQGLLDLRHPTDKKASKPLMEKRRRARINHSLAQLKTLVVDPGTTEQRSRQAKLEKADILELTVRHLHDIQRRQRTTALRLEGRQDPGKRFEIGYFECAREVELYLSDWMSLDAEVRQRLKDHLNGRLRDLSSLEPRDAASRKEELSDEEDTEDSSDSSALNTMMTHYAERGTPDSDAPSVEDLLRPKEIHSRPTGEDRGTAASSCHSVTSTTGCRSPDVATTSEPAQGSERRLRTVAPTAAIKTHTPEECLDHRSEPLHLTSPRVRESAPPLRDTSARHTADGRTLAPTSLQRQRGNDSNHSGCISPASFEDENMNRQSPSSSAQTKQIPLVPRQLANGDWALVLPASLVPTSREEESHPFSAFRLVVPTSPGTDAHAHNRQRPHSSSSSTASDMSYEECGSRSDGDRIERSAPDSSTQVVWRPW